MNKTPEQMDQDRAAVRRRQVFYIPGYDPIPPRRYRELYRKEGAEQAAISGYQVALEGKLAPGSYGWQVTSQMEGGETHAQIDVLVWSDIVRGSMDLSIAQTYVLLARTAWIYISTGVLWRLMRLRKGPLIAALYPVAMLIGQLILALLAGHVLGRVAGLVVSPSIWTMVIHIAVLLVISALMLRWFRKLDHKLFAYYLMHDYAHSAADYGATPTALRARMEVFEDQIAQALLSDTDEVLVVGHSSGAHIGISVLADLIRAGRVPDDGPALSFLTLGQVVPMVSFLPKADQLRRDLHDLSQQSVMPWVDVTAPGDGCAFALCDPVCVTGVAPDRGKTGPLVLSAAFTQTLSPARWKALRWRFFRLHFQYLCAFDQPGAYDYFRITAGPKTLGERFAGRAPSASRIERPVSKFTRMAP